MMKIGKISKLALSRIYKMRVDVLDMMIRHLKLPTRSNEDEFSEEELKLIFKEVGNPFIERK